MLNLCAFHQAQAQCTTSVIDWDYREFFARNSSTIRGYVSLAQSQTQYFAMGTNKVTATHTYTSNSSIAGDNTDNTAEAGSYGTGADVEFTGNGTVSFSFANSVTNLKFSLYDIDRGQRVQITAFNGATAINVTMTKIGGSVLTISNNNSTTAEVNASNTTVDNSNTNGTINIDIAGTVTSFNIIVSNTGTCSSSCGGGGDEDGQYWISDITACSSGSFPATYYIVSRPFTGMPGYVIMVRDNVFYYVNPATGNCKYLFKDNTSSNMNSLAYDPVKRLLYYTYSLSGPGNGVNSNEKSLRRYDVNMDTFGVALSNVNNLGIPTFGQGVESGAASFYNDNLYWGIEGNSSTEIESIIWRIELNAANFPIAYSQVYAQEVTTGGSRLHDWADFGVNNGTLYDFDGGVANSSTGQNTDFWTQNLLTGIVNRYTPLAHSGVAQIPHQTAIDWNGVVYNIGAGGPTGLNGSVETYNLTNDIATQIPLTVKGVAFSGGSFGDGAEAFRPLVDYGDAPLSYDPTLLTAAVNERDTSLRIGPRLDIEWLTRGQTALADQDNFDDGISTVTIFSNLYSTYHVTVRVWNNTGSTANLRGWFDWNNNGVFDAGEASAAATVTSGIGLKNVNLNWTGISSTMPTGAYTYLRIRLSTTAMAASSASGWQDNGETEDYRVSVQNIVLPLELLAFDAKVINSNKVSLTWSASEDNSSGGYEIQRSHNGTNWERIAFVPSTPSNGVHSYETIDDNPYKGSSRYRIKITETGSQSKYSEIKILKITDRASLMTISPNPASTKASLSILGDLNGEIAQVRIMDTRGNELSYVKTRLTVGTNNIDLPIKSSWPSGTYIVIVTTDEGTVNRKLLINK